MPNFTERGWPSRLMLVAALSSALVPLPATLAVAGSVERLGPPTASVAVPGREPGAFRTWVQLVWNPATRTLERLSLTAWDPIPSLGLELSWQPDDPAANRAGPIEGRGTLSFRTPGAAAYDPAGTVAQYRGVLVAGRAEGIGEFIDNAGYAYSGAWRAGLMEGQGRLTLADGDDYVGAFRAGLADGEGTLVDSAGRVWSGHFTAGVPDAAPLLAQGQGDLTLGVVTERRPHNYQIGADALSYVTRNDNGTLTMLPDDQRLLDAWHGDASITMTDEEQSASFGAGITPSFLGARERFEPLSLVYALENTTAATLSVRGGYIDVASSTRNPEPAMQVRSFPKEECSVEYFLPRFFIDDFGWTSADNATLNYSVGSLDGRKEGTPLSLPLGSIAESTTADLGPQLKSLGVDADFLSENRLACTDSQDQRLCLGELRQSGRFGKLADFISLDYTNVEISVAGTLDYDWTAADGSGRHKSSPFSVVLPIASVANEAECGDGGGEVIPVGRDPFKLKLDARNYRVALPFTGDVAPGFTARWRIELSAPETSDHEFRIVLLLADGTRVSSRPVKLTYFMPPVREHLAQP